MSRTNVHGPKMFEPLKFDHSYLQGKHLKLSQTMCVRKKIILFDIIAPDKRVNQVFFFFFYFSMKTYVVGTH